MKTIWYLSVGLCMLFCGEDRCQGAITATATRGLAATDLDGLISTDDLLDGLIATEMPGDQGWHPVNPAASNSLHPDGLPAFTDGVGTLSTLTGLLNDFPGEGTPAKLLEYDLGGSFDINQIGILTGNLDADGRIFSTFVIRVSTDNGGSFSPLGGIVPNFGGGVTANNFGYYQSDATGMINKDDGNPALTIDQANLVEIYDDGVAPIANGVTHIQFDFYASNNSDGMALDPWGDENPPYAGTNPFTGIDDALPRAISSPLVWEIDVIGQPAAAVDDADFDGNFAVDGNDMLIWQRGLGLAGQIDNSNGDADFSGSIDGADLEVWETQYGTTPALVGVAAVPEPTSAILAVIALACAAATTRRRA